MAAATDRDSCSLRVLQRQQATATRAGRHANTAMSSPCALHSGGGDGAWVQLRWGWGAVTHWTTNRIELLGQDHPRLENPAATAGTAQRVVPLDTLTDRRAAKRNCAQPAAGGRIVHMAAECASAE